MTEDDARKIKDPRTIAWDEPCFVFVVERYYLGMSFMNIPKWKGAPQGGDLTAQFWRFNSTPNEWIITYRFRRYISDKVWNSHDPKNWFVGKFSGDETVADREMVQFSETASGVTGLFFAKDPPKIHSIIFKSDSEKALNQILIEKPFWLHMKVKQ